MMGRACLDVPCQIKCVCAEGLVRIDGQCVSRKNCSIKPIEKCLMPNTEYKTCFNPCTQSTCGRLEELVRCAYACVNGCYCKEGFVKSDDGSCIKLDQCPKHL